MQAGHDFLRNHDGLPSTAKKGTTIDPYNSAPTGSAQAPVEADSWKIERRNGQKGACTHEATRLGTTIRVNVSGFARRVYKGVRVRYTILAVRKRALIVV